MATKQGSNKKIFLIAGAVVLGVAGYFGYNWWKKRKDAKDTGGGSTGGGSTTDLNTGVGSTTDLSSGGSTGGGSGSGSGSSTTSSNPFKTESEVLKFQQWVINTKKDKTILGTGGASGYGDDGKWGSKSGTAWDKYGKEYLTGSDTKVYAGLDKDIDVIINNRYNSGAKAERSYLRATALKYPAFVQNWADAVRKRYESNGQKGTTFIFANQIYDSFQAEVQAPANIIGKTMKAKSGDVYVFTEPNRYSANRNLSELLSDAKSGVVKNYFFNKDQRIFFLYVPNDRGSNLVWYPIRAIEKFV